MTFDLDRFKRAQDGPDGYAIALAELQSGRKRSHWIWYVFPQLAGLGRTRTAIAFGLNGPAEAEAYLRDPLLRERLLAVTEAVAVQLRRNPVPALEDVMGSEIDALKLVSSMTLFRETGSRCGDAHVASAAEEVLAIARSQGFAECQFTLDAIGRQA